jgi:PKD repeat protein
MKKAILFLLLPLFITSCKKDQTPSADFSYTGTLEVGKSIAFNNLSKNANVFSWDFGDGAVSTAQSPTYTYPKPGTYTVILKAEGNGQAATATKQVAINGTTYSFKNNTTVDLYSFTTFYWTGAAIEDFTQHGLLGTGKTTGIVITYRSEILFAFKFVAEGDYFFSANPFPLTLGTHNALTIEETTPIAGKGGKSGSLPWYNDFLKLSDTGGAVIK